MQRLVERGILDGEIAARLLADELRDAVTVERFPAEGLENQDIDGALEQTE